MLNPPSVISFNASSLSSLVYIPLRILSILTPPSLYLTSTLVSSEAPPAERMSSGSPPIQLFSLRIGRTYPGPPPELEGLMITKVVLNQITVQSVCKVDHILCKALTPMDRTLHFQHGRKTHAHNGPKRNTYIISMGYMSIRPAPDDSECLLLIYNIECSSAEGRPYGQRRFSEIRER